MMKLILSLTLIWTFSSTAEARKCWVGEGSSLVFHPCSSSEVCATVATQVPEKTSTKRECVPSSLFSVDNHIFSYNVGFRATTEIIRVCNTDGCNIRDVPYPGFQDKNNLHCLACDNLFSAVCNKTVQCVGMEDRCINGTVGYNKGKQARVFGCASANLCEGASHLEFLLTFKFLQPPKCCGSNFCNSAWSVKLNVMTLLFGVITFIF